MFYTEEDLRGSAESVSRLFGCFDAVLRYGMSRATLIFTFTRDLLFQEINYYKTFIRD